MNTIKYALCFIALFSFFSCSYNAVDLTESELESATIEKNYIELNPKTDDPSTCFLFYPGALVEPEAYVHTLSPLCLLGYKVIIIKATADLAILNPKRAEKIVADFPDIENWIIGGHSLGGVMAAKSVVENSSIYKGLILFASYPASGDDLTDWDGSVLSISAENDSLSTPTDIEASKALLPGALVVDSLDEFPVEPTTEKAIFFQIKGGNHAQFGDYGIQKNDGEATISIEEQHTQIVNAISLFLNAIGGKQK